MDRLQLLMIICLVGYCWANCEDKVKRCEEQFVAELQQNNYANSYTEYGTFYYDICNSNGTYSRFTNCIGQLTGQCSNLPGQLCTNRAFKMSIHRYTWRHNLIHDLCYRTSTVLDQNFFKHEKCISEVLNTPKWSCDEHLKMTKKTSDSCPHWKDYRQCGNADVVKHCGQETGSVADYLMHTHSSYFGYKSCNFPGESFTKCWYDSIFSVMPKASTKAPVTTTPTVPTTTTLVTSPPPPPPPEVSTKPAERSSTTGEIAEDSEEEESSEMSTGRVFQNDKPSVKTIVEGSEQTLSRESKHTMGQNLAQEQYNTGVHATASFALILIILNLLIN